MNDLNKYINKCNISEFKKIFGIQDINNIIITTKKEKLTILQYIIKKCNSDFLKEVLNNYNININKLDDLGRSALWYAIGLGRFKKAKILINFGANSTIEDGFTSFHWLTSIGKIGLINDILRIKNKGFKINKQDYDSTGTLDRTALHWAAQENQIEIAKSLIKNGININLIDSGGKTALHIAAGEGYFDFVKLLLRHHADKNIKDKSKITPKKYAILYNHKKIAKLFD